MDPLVLDQVGLVGESFATVQTGERLLSRVNPAMDEELGLLAKMPAAVQTGEEFLTSPNRPV